LRLRKYEKYVVELKKVDTMRKLKCNLLKNAQKSLRKKKQKGKKRTKYNTKTQATKKL